MKLLITLAVVAATLAVAAPVSALSKPHVIATARSAGDVSFTIASGEAKARSAWVRGYGRGLSSQASAICSRGLSSGSKDTAIRRMMPGRLYAVQLPFGGDCIISASLDGRGPIRLQILAG